MIVGGSTFMWMAAKMFWKEDPPEWFFFVITFGWLTIFALAMNLIRRGVLL